MQSPQTSSERIAMRDATKRSVANYQLSGRVVAKIVDVYDGDTVTAAAYVAGPKGSPAELAALKVRILGLDTPEIPTQSEFSKVRGDHRPFGVERNEGSPRSQVRDALRALIMDRTVVLDVPRTRRPDPRNEGNPRSHGRLLGRVYVACAEKTSETIEAVVTVRGKDVCVPRTRDLEGAEEDCEAAVPPALTEVTRWLIENRLAKPYNPGRTGGAENARGYTEAEIANGLAD